MIHSTTLRILAIGMLLLMAGCARAPESPEPVPTATPQGVVTPTLATATESPTSTSAPSPTASPTAESATPEPASLGALPQGLVALVNDVPIEVDDYVRQVAQAEALFLQQPGLDAHTEEGAQALEAFRRQILGWMIDQVLIQQAAEGQGIAIAQEDVEAEIARMQGADPERFDRWLAANGLTLETLRDQLATEMRIAAVRDLVTSQLSRVEVQVHVQHILTSEESAAQAVLERLQQGESFGAVAQEVSEDESTRESGGDLGFLPRGVMPSEFDEAAFGLGAGEISDVVRSEYGYHIIQVIEIDPARNVSDDLWPVVQQRSFEDWLAQQRTEADIMVAEDPSRYLASAADGEPAS